MKGLSISCLALGGQISERKVEAAVAAGFGAIEIVPGLVWPEYPDVSQLELVNTKRLLDSFGLGVSGVQSILFGFPDIQLLDSESWPQLRERVSHAAEICNFFESSNLIFGSPRNRLRGHLDPGTADEMAVEALTTLIPALRSTSTRLLIEPNAPEYGADYLTHATEVASLVSRVASRFVGTQFDSGCLHLVGDDLRKAFSDLSPSHVHVSEPGLEFPPVTVNHQELRSIMAGSDYRGWVVLEALAEDAESPPADKLRWFTHHYSMPVTP